MNTVYLKKIVLLRSKSTSPTKLVNFLIHVTFKIKDFKGHYLKLEVLQDYTEFAFMRIVYFEKNYIIEVQQHITILSCQLPYICDLQNQGFRRSLLQTSGTSRLY